MNVDRYTLANSQGMEVGVMTYGAIVTSVRVPDAKGRIDDVVLGFDTLQGYLGSHPYFGAVVGRFANRICNGRCPNSTTICLDRVMVCTYYLHGENFIAINLFASVFGYVKIDCSCK